MNPAKQFDAGALAAGAVELGCDALEDEAVEAYYEPRARSWADYGGTGAAVSAHRTRPDTGGTSARKATGAVVTGQHDRRAGRRGKIAWLPDRCYATIRTP
jgi:hypothetical protein